MPGADGGTVVEIEHRGSEWFGQAAPIAATGTTGAGAGVIRLFVAGVLAGRRRVRVRRG